MRQVAKKNSGFSLVEILVVVLILGIMMSIAVMAFGDFGHSRQVLACAQQFENYLKLVRQQAILQASPLGIELHPHSYQVVQFSSDGLWVPVINSPIFKVQYIPKNTTLVLEPSTNHKNNPAIMIDTSGDLTPFTLHFLSEKQHRIATVLGTFNGSITLNTP